MISLNKYLNKNNLRRSLRQPSLVPQAYREVIEHPERLNQLSDSEAISFYAIACLSENVFPQGYAGLHSKGKPKPNNGFLDYLIEHTDSLTDNEETRIWAKKAAGSFVPTKMMPIQRGVKDPLTHPVSGLGEGYRGNQSTNSTQ